MKKSKPGIAGIHDQDHLFHEAALRRHRTLILPRYLDDEVFRLKNRHDEIDIAHQILLRWANLETDGHLRGKETELDDSFRQDVFGKALNYLTSTTSPTAYYYAKGFYVPGIGPPDGVLGNFPPVDPKTIRVVMELKDASTDLDHDKFNGRTPVQQCWDYLNNLPDCPWGIVSNFVSFRLYHRDKTQQAFEHFELQKLRDPEQFVRFWALFERGGLLTNHLIKTCRAEELMRRTGERQKEVGDKLYEFYSDQRRRLIDELMVTHRKSKDQALRRPKAHGPHHLHRLLRRSRSTAVEIDRVHVEERPSTRPSHQSALAELSHNVPRHRQGPRQPRPPDRLQRRPVRQR